MYLSELTDFSLPKMGENLEVAIILTVIHAHANDIKSDPTFKQE